MKSGDVSLDIVKLRNSRIFNNENGAFQA